MSEVYRKEIPFVGPEYQVANSPTVTRTKRKGTVVREIAVATYDFSVDGGAVGAIPLGVYLPAGAIVTRAWVDVVTTCTTASADAGTMALHLQAADDIVAAVAVSAADDVWDAGMHGSKIGFPNFGADAAHDSAVEVAALFAATFLKLTAIRQITATIAGQAFTAGKFNVFVEYAISD